MYQLSEIFFRQLFFFAIITGNTVVCLNVYSQNKYQNLEIEMVCTKIQCLEI